MAAPLGLLALDRLAPARAGALRAWRGSLRRLKELGRTSRASSQPGAQKTQGQKGNLALFSCEGIEARAIEDAQTRLGDGGEQKRRKMGALRSTRQSPCLGDLLLGAREHVSCGGPHPRLPFRPERTLGESQHVEERARAQPRRPPGFEGGCAHGADEAERDSRRLGSGCDRLRSPEKARHGAGECARARPQPSLELGDDRGTIAQIGGREKVIEFLDTCGDQRLEVVERDATLRKRVGEGADERMIDRSAGCGARELVAPEGEAQQADLRPARDLHRAGELVVDEEKREQGRAAAGRSEEQAERAVGVAGAGAREQLRLCERGGVRHRHGARAFFASTKPLFSHSSSVETSRRRGTRTMPFTLPELPYPHDWLEPYIGRETMELHHGKHHQAYVTNLNNLTAGTDLENKPLEEVCRLTFGDPSKASIFNNAGQHWNHCLFWRVMKRGGGGKPGGELLKRIEHDFGSYEAFAEQFKTAAVTQFGSGWAWLSLDGDRLKVSKTPNGENPLVHGMRPILGIDVWEHAYYLDYRWRRPDYVAAFLNHLVNWEAVEEELHNALA